MSKNELNLQQLKNIIGADKYIQVCDNMPGEKIYIPAFLNGFTSIEDRNKAIRNDFDTGKCATELAKKYNLSVSQVFLHLLHCSS